MTNHMLKISYCNHLLILYLSKIPFNKNISKKYFKKIFQKNISKKYFKKYLIDINVI
jgi:hypothetical protein